jgi:hypothetical protein
VFFDTHNLCPLGVKEERKIAYDEVQNKSDIVLSNKNRPYSKWKEMDESFKFILNEDKGSSLHNKANLYVEKIQKFKKLQCKY